MLKILKNKHFEKSKIIKTKFIRIISIIFSIFFGIILINIIFLNKTIHINYKIPLMIILPIIMYILIYLLHSKTKLFNKEFKIIEFIPILIIVFIIQINLANLTYANCGWDCQQVVVSALKLNTGEIIKARYFLSYTNNLGVLLLFKYILQPINLFFELTETSSFFILIVFNIFIVDLAVIFLLAICKKILGNKSCYIALLLAIPFMILFPYILVPYTDTLTMIFPILILYLYILIKEEKSNLRRNLLTILEGIILAIGMILKPTVIIMIIAITMCEICLSKLKIKNIIVTILLFIIGFSSIYLGFEIIKKENLGIVFSKERYYRHEFPMTHFIMMGMGEQEIEEKTEGKNNILYGSYNVNDVIATDKIHGKNNKTEYHISEIQKRLKNFGFLGYINFLYNKANWILSDGTFFFGREGEFWTTEQHNDSQIGINLQKFVNVKTEEYKKVTVNVLQTEWILIIIGLIFSVNKKQNVYISISKLSIIGIILFILIFEGRSRYLVNYIPIFILVGTYGLQNSFNVLTERKKKYGAKKSNTCNTNVL